MKRVLSSDTVFHWLFLSSQLPHPLASPAHPQGLISRATHLRGNGSCAHRPAGRAPAGVLGGQHSAHSHGACGGQAEAEGLHTGSCRFLLCTHHLGWRRSSLPLGQTEKDREASAPKPGDQLPCAAVACDICLVRDTTAATTILLPIPFP